MITSILNEKNNNGRNVYGKMMNFIDHYSSYKDQKIIMYITYWKKLN